MKLSLNKLNLSLGVQLEQEACRGIGISHFFGKNEWLYRIEKWINSVNQGYRGNFKGFVVLTRGRFQRLGECRVKVVNNFNKPNLPSLYYNLPSSLPKAH